MKMGIGIVWVLLMGLHFSRAAMPDSGQMLAQDNAAFAVDLYQKLHTQEGNFFFSPYSISAALGMTYGGARGETALQMDKVLRFSLPPESVHPAFAKLNRTLAAVQKEGNVTLGIANSIWPSAQYTLLDSYVSLLKANYDVSVTSLDYGKTEASRRMINGWVADKTQDKIKELIGPGVLTPNTRLTLVNAIYFKGSWVKSFDAKETQEREFHAIPDKPVFVPMMEAKSEFAYADLGAFQVLELPYQGGGISMVVILPKSLVGLGELESKMNREKLTEWKESVKLQQVRVYLPKFKLDWGTFSLKEPLRLMGMRDAFDDGKADFSGMDGKRNTLVIGDVLHKAFVEVNEEGTEAAAATAVEMKFRSAMIEPPPVPVFRADHPFLFLIQEKRTGSILFMGRVVNPQ